MINIHSFVEETIKLAEEASKEFNIKDLRSPRLFIAHKVMDAIQPSVKNKTAEEHLRPHPITELFPKDSKASKVLDNSPIGRILSQGVGGAAGGALGGLIAGVSGKKPKYVIEGAAAGALAGMGIGGMIEASRHVRNRTEKEKVAITLNEVELVKRQPQTSYGKLREGLVGATKGALAGSGVAALMKKSPQVGAAIGAGSYLLDRNLYGQGEKLAAFVAKASNDEGLKGGLTGAVAGGITGSILAPTKFRRAAALGGTALGGLAGYAKPHTKTAGIGLPTNSLAFTPAKARAAKQFTSALQPHTNPMLPPSHIVGGKSGRIRMSSGPKIAPPSAGNVV